MFNYISCLLYLSDQDLLSELESNNNLVFTPSRRVAGQKIVCYDDRYVLDVACDTDGIVVSNDNYRDLIKENEKYRQIVDNRLLMFSFFNDK